MVAVILGWVCYNLYKKMTIYEDWIYETKLQVHETWETMKSIDDQHMFESDDEVGVVFTELKLVLDDLDKKVGENIYAGKEND